MLSELWSSPAFALMRATSADCSIVEEQTRLLARAVQTGDQNYCIVAEGEVEVVQQTRGRIAARCRGPAL